MFVPLQTSDRWGKTQEDATGIGYERAISFPFSPGLYFPEGNKILSTIM